MRVCVRATYARAETFTFLKYRGSVAHGFCSRSLFCAARSGWGNVLAHHPRRVRESRLRAYRSGRWHRHRRSPLRSLPQSAPVPRQRPLSRRPSPVVPATRKNKGTCVQAHALNERCPGAWQERRKCVGSRCLQANRLHATHTPATGARPRAKGRAQLAALATPAASFSPERSPAQDTQHAPGRGAW